MSAGDEAPFKDHFSGHAASYASSRPRYPDALFAHLADCCDTRELAWDCATGNGQAARSLAAYFDRVVATDASAEQVASADPHPGIVYRVAPAEAPGLDPHTVDLITVAQALHWFDITEFFAAAISVLRPGGVLAYWSYGLCSVNPACDEITQAAYEFVDDYWPPERAMVETGYRDIEPPLPRIPCPEFDMQLAWSAEQMLDYMNTWSACQRCARATASDPLDGFAEKLRSCWGPGTRTVHWPLALTAVRAPALSSD